MKKRQSRVEVPLLMDPIAPRDLDFYQIRLQFTTCRQRTSKPSPDLPAETGTGWASSPASHRLGIKDSDPGRGLG